MIRTEELVRRRQRLMTEAGPQAAIVVGASSPRTRNGSAFYPYRQDSDFLYLTGLSEPEALLVLCPGRHTSESVLFLRPHDPERERWDGKRVGLDGAREQLGMTDAYPIEDLEDILPGLLEGRTRIHHLIGRHDWLDRHMLRWHRQQTAERTGLPAPEIMALEPLLHEQRLIKSHDEIRCMRKAARISAAAIARAMRACQPGMNEAEIEAELVHEYTRHRCPPAYLPIVAGGANACTLHYIENNQPLPDDGLLLIDAGCESDGYAADISRTFPVNGRFSPAQRAVYDVVLEAQRQAIDQVRPGRAYQDFHEKAVEVLTQGLIDLGLLHGSLEDNLERGSYRRFYMHKTGHWLGLDVHDVGDYRIEDQWRLLEKNMVTTVEPGLYIDAGEDIPAEFRNIGIRIEDDIRVTDDEPDNLTRAVPVEAEEIEAWMRG